MPYIGRGITTGDFTVITLTESFDGSRVDFTMSESVGNVNQLLVILSGVLQHWTDAFTISGTTLTFSSAPAGGETIKILKLGDVVNIGVPSDSSVTPTKMAGTLDLSSKTVTLPAASVTAHVTSYDDNKLQSNIALLGFKTAVNGSLAKYNLQDQIIDEYEDATGVDASASTNELLTAGAYAGSGGGSAPTGGNTSSSGGYFYHWYLIGDTGENFVVNNTTNVEFLLVGGGGQAGSGTSGGGGAGGLIYVPSASLPAGTYAITIGAGGSGNTDGNPRGDAGSNSVISDGTRVFTALGGGGGGNYYSGAYNQATTGGGSAAAHAGYNVATSANNTAETPTSPFTASGGNITTGGVTYSNVAFGNNAGIQYQSGDGGSGGGGGAGGVGQNGVAYNTAGGGAGGAGKSIASFNHTLWGGSSNTYYAAGGSGANKHHGNSATNGIGGYSATNEAHDGTDGMANTGSGGGGTWNHGGPDGGDGGSGIAIMRYQATDYASVADLTLQSTDTTASTEASNADMVMLMENASGTATINTDIKGWISRDSGTTFTQGTLVDEGTWGTNKKILAFHDLDISGQPSGTDMCYKITTHNQSAGSKETKIHATSIGWR